MVTRRDAIAGLTVGLAASVLAGCRGKALPSPVFPEPVPGAAQVVTRANGPGHTIALTIDDGFDAAVVDAYLKFAEDTGFEMTFNPIGVLARVWDPRAPRLRKLVESGQVQIGNHTFHHKDLTVLPDARIREEVEMNDDWIRAKFGITSRPYLRPPSGLHNFRTDALCGTLGYTKILMWQGSFEDAVPTTREKLLRAARVALTPGAIVIGHANQPTVTTLYPELIDLIRQRRLQPRTLDQMFGTSRTRGT